MQRNQATQKGQLSLPYLLPSGEKSEQVVSKFVVPVTKRKRLVEKPEQEVEPKDAIAASQNTKTDQEKNSRSGKDFRDTEIDEGLTSLFRETTRMRRLGLLLLQCLASFTTRRQRPCQRFRGRRQLAP